MKLREYQTRCLDEARAKFAAGSRSVLVVAPTGAGKTVLGASIVEGHVRVPGRSALWLAHRNELVDQAESRLTASGLTCGVIAATAGQRVNPFARVQVASVQTLRARKQLPPATLVVADEAHHFAESNDWTELLKHYKAAGSLVVGLTATPERGDGQGLGEVFDGLVVAASMRELIDLGHLVPCEVVAPDGVLRSGEIAQRPVDAYLEHARGRRAICFSPHVKAAREHLDEFLAAGVRAGLIHGELVHHERSQILRRYKAGELDVLVNVFVLTEGFDDPPTSCVILARGCGTAGTYLQMVGRMLRPAPDKTNALLLDLRGVVHVHGKPDHDWKYSLDGTAIRREDEQPGRLCSVCGAPLKESERVCPDCGRAPAELEAPRVVGVALAKYAGKRNESDADRAATLARWLREARLKSFKEGWAMAKYNAVYGGWPPFAIKRAALEMMRTVAA